MQKKSEYAWNQDDISRCFQGHIDRPDAQAWPPGAAPQSGQLDDIYVLETIWKYHPDSMHIQIFYQEKFSGSCEKFSATPGNFFSLLPEFFPLLPENFSATPGKFSATSRKIFRYSRKFFLQEKFSGSCGKLFTSNISYGILLRSHTQRGTYVMAHLGNFCRCNWPVGECWGFFWRSYFV